MIKEILKSKFGAALGVVLLVVTVFYFAKETYRKRQINGIIRGLQTEIDSLEGKNNEILELISYYKTTTYKERQARTLLGLQKEGEFAVALPQEKTADKGDDSQKDDKQSNLSKWWNYFFNK